MFISSFSWFPVFIDLLMGVFRGAVFHHGGVPENSPLALGAFPVLNGPFSDLNGPFPRLPEWAVFHRLPYRAVFPLANPLENSPLRKGTLRVS